MNRNVFVCCLLLIFQHSAQAVPTARPGGECFKGGAALRKPSYATENVIVALSRFCIEQGALLPPKLRASCNELVLTLENEAKEKVFPLL